MIKLLIFLNYGGFYNFTSMQRSVLLLLSLLVLGALAFQSPSSNLDATLQNILTSRSLMGIQYEITNRTHTLYHGNFGLRDGKNPIQN